MLKKYFQPMLITRLLGTGRHGFRSPVYPTAVNSYNPSNGQITPNEQQQLYKTTIPVYANQQHESCKCQIKNSAQTADIVIRGAPVAAIGNNNGASDVVNITQHGIPSAECCCRNTGTAATTKPAMRSSPENENQTTKATTTTTVEYELSNGVAQLCKISTSRVAAEDFSSSTLPQSYAVLPTELKSLSHSLNAINSLSNSFGHISSQNNLYRQQRANYCMDHKGAHGETNALGAAPRDRLGLWATGGDNEVPGNVSGQQRLHVKKYNKGLAFTHEERQLLGIHGLLPAVVKSEEEQVQHCLMLLDRLENDLDKYMYLNGLAERNERLFYKVLASNVRKMMPLVYTPTVGLACQKFSLVYQHPKGLYITIKDKGHIYEVLKNWPETDIRAICVTDGARILGLGDLGANGMGIPVGKLSLYTALAGIKPHQCLPVTLDVGTNTESILNDPLYIGLRHKRVTGEEYDEFIDEFMNAVVRRFGQNCLIQFEDFANANAFRLLAKYRNKYCTFNDDIQGTASVALAGLLASLKITHTKLKDNKVLFQGAGEAALGIANLCVMALMKEGLSEAEAKQRIWMIDSKGLIIKNRPAGGLTEHKLHFAHEHPPINTLSEAIDIIKPTVLIGAAAIGGTFTKEILEKMAAINETPVIFALSNPTSKAECTAEEAYTYTKGKCVFASGSPFDPVEYNGKTYYPGQGNNSYIFPGVALGVLTSGLLTIPEDVFLMSAEKLADLCGPEDLEKGSLYPPLSKITSCSVEIAAYIMEYAYKNSLATVRPEPKNKHEFIRSQMYDLKYPPALPEVYSWSDKL